jgi:hypothetical protein
MTYLIIHTHTAYGVFTGYKAFLSLEEAIAAMNEVQKYDENSTVVATIYHNHAYTHQRVI